MLLDAVGVESAALNFDEVVKAASACKGTK
jgi:hypothetical protein